MNDLSINITKFGDLTPKERFFTLLEGKEADRAAVINPTSVATVESCGKLGINLSEVHLDSEKMTALATHSYENLGFDSVMPYFSVIQEAAAFGCGIDWGTGDAMPNQKSVVFTDPEQFKMPDDFLDRLPIKTVVESIAGLRKRLGRGALIIGKVMGPWTLSYQLHGVEDFLVETITEPETVKEFLDRFKKITIAFAAAQFEAGADIITLADHATADLVSPVTYKELLLPVHKEINKYFNDRKFILHCCGNTLDRMHLFAEAGFPVFHFDSKNDIGQSTKASGSMMLTGCVNNPEVLLKGTAGDVEKQVEEILAGGIRLVSPECAIPLKVSNANLEAIAQTVRDWGK